MNNPLRKLLQELQELADTRIEMKDTERDVGRKIGRRELLEQLEEIIKELEDGDI